MLFFPCNILILCGLRTLSCAINNLHYSSDILLPHHWQKALIKAIIPQRAPQEIEPAIFLVSDAL